MNQPTYPPLTTYKITYSDGNVVETNMAAHVTLKMATDYFGQMGGMNSPIALRVEMLEGPRPWVGKTAA